MCLFREKCLFWENLLIFGKCAYFENWRIRIFGIVYTVTGYLFFQNPPLPKISTFSLGKKGCASYRKCAYYEWGQYI